MKYCLLLLAFFAMTFAKDLVAEKEGQIEEVDESDAMDQSSDSERRRPWCPRGCPGRRGCPRNCRRRRW